MAAGVVCDERGRGEGEAERGRDDSLRSAGLNICGIGDASATILARLLQGNSSLQWLS